jgi:6,7-dimethyl-8-ribityllumazine synthase
MPREISAKLDATGLAVAVVASRFNAAITEKLVSGALDCLTRHGARGDDLTVVWVPGALEIPLACRKLAASGKVHAVVAIGAVIRGATSHYDVVVSESARGLSRVMEDTGVPVANAILTTDSIEQATERAGVKSGNKGWDAALSAIEMANLLKELGKSEAGAIGTGSSKKAK